MDFEHNTVYTAGTSSKENDLLDKNLKIKTNRGGKHTLHGPGSKSNLFCFKFKKEKEILGH